MMCFFTPSCGFLTLEPSHADPPDARLEEFRRKPALLEMGLETLGPP